MAHFAQLDEANFVINVIVINNAAIGDLSFPESEPVGVTFCQSLYGANTVWKQTSYNAKFRQNYAGFGYTYDPVLDAFIAPQPYPSWLLNPTTYQWEPPIPFPIDDGVYVWDEATQSWLKEV